MRFATVAVVAYSTLVSCALAASIYRRQQFDDEVTTLTRRNGFMTCSSVNNYDFCGTTHECLTTSGPPTHKTGIKTGMHEKYSFCTTDCICQDAHQAQPFKISSTKQLKNGQRSGARSGGRAEHRR